MDKILSFIKNNSQLIIIIFIALVIIIAICSGCAPSKPKKRKRPRPKPTVSKPVEVTKLTYNIIVNGNGTIELQEDKYEIEELKDFEVQITEESKIRLKWYTSDGHPMEIQIKGNGDEKSWKSPKGDVSFDIGKKSSEPCFIRSTMF